MNTLASAAEVAASQSRAAEDGRWLEAHVLLGWLDALPRHPVYRCLRAGCGQLLPHTYAEAFCSSACAEAYRLTTRRRAAA